MANIMSDYELVFILKVSLGEEAIASTVEKFKSLIAENGTVAAVDEWGKRRLAYLINDETEGYYVEISFKANNAFPAELDRQLKITDGVLRSLIVKKDEKENKPGKAKKAEAVPAETAASSEKAEKTAE